MVVKHWNYRLLEFYIVSIDHILLLYCFWHIFSLSLKTRAKNRLDWYWLLFLDIPNLLYTPEICTSDDTLFQLVIRVTISLPSRLTDQIFSWMQHHLDRLVTPRQTSLYNVCVKSDWSKMMLTRNVWSFCPTKFMNYPRKLTSVLQNWLT